MHKIMALGLLLVAFGISKASDWVSIPLANSNKVAVVMLDSDSVFISGNHRRAWFKLVMLPHSQKGAGTYENRYVTYAMTRVTFDCQQRNSMTDGLQWFYEDGANNTTPQSAPSWEPVPPDSMGDTMLSYICAWKPK
jgi:hypothetical protein